MLSLHGKPDSMYARTRVMHTLRISPAKQYATMVTGPLWRSAQSAESDSLNAAKATG